MKKAENYAIEYSVINDNDELDKKDLLLLIKQVQEDVIKETVKECMKNVELDYFEYEEDWMEEPFNITKDDLGNITGFNPNKLLSVADKLIKEL